MEFQCPHCGINMSAEEEYAGQMVACPGCSQRLRIPGPPDEGAETGAETLQRPKRRMPRGGWQEEDHANINFWFGLLIAVTITGAFLLMLAPFQGKAFADIFLKRGWVNYAESFLFIWGMVILFLKWRKSLRQRDAMLLDVLPASVGAEINAENVSTFIDRLYKLPSRLRDSLMVNRIRKALELFEKRNDNSEVTVLLNAQSDIDANRISGSYTLLKVFLWAIPILGFIGTVQGLSQAVGSLSAGSADPAELKNSINNLTGGLGVAFDTTLLGLVLSMIMSFPMASMQKHEEEMLTLIDAFCSEKLLPRLNDSKNHAAPKLPEGEALPAFVASLAEAHRTFLEQLQQATALLSNAGETLRVRLDAHQDKVEHSFTQALDRLTAVTSNVITKPAKEMNEYIAGLHDGIATLNDLLEKLGGETIVVKKRGFFSR